MIYKWEIIGHQASLQSLEQDIRQNKVAHAYLFYGPPQTGKQRIAQTFASILQCTQGYCRRCDDCKQIEKRCHPDTLFMDDHGESIKIDDIRSIIRHTSLNAHGKHRIVVIENAERMPIEAQNSFLKILEEPTGRTLFILSTGQMDHILPTIQSRTRNVYFPNLDNRLIQHYLEEKQTDSRILGDIVTVAQGRPGMAIGLAKNPVRLEEQLTLYRRIEKMLSENNSVSKMLYVEEIEKEPLEIDRFLDALGRYLRTKVHQWLDPKEAKNASSRLQRLVMLYDSLEQSQKWLDQNVNKRLVLENLMLKAQL